MVEENTGTRIARPSKSRLKRLRRGREDGSLDGDNDLRTGGARERGTHEMNDMWADEGPVTVQRRDEEEEEEGDFDDDMGGFIEADDDDEENAMGEAERQERLERRRAEKERRKIAGFPKLAGLDQKYVNQVLSIYYSQRVTTVPLRCFTKCLETVQTTIGHSEMILTSRKNFVKKRNTQT